MSLTGAQLLTGFSRFIGDLWESTTTAAGSSAGTTLADTMLGRFGDDTLIGHYLRPTGATNQYEVRRITDFTAASGIATVTPAFTAQTGSAEAYGLHRYDPTEKFRALDDARIRVYPDLGKFVFSDQLTGDGLQNTFDVPSAIRQGPAYVLVEDPLSISDQWNFIQDPRGDSTTNWSATSCTHSTVSRLDNDPGVPKYDDTCSKVVVSDTTNGTLKQAVASMTNSADAALAAGRKMTFAVWVKCHEADRVTLTLEDDTSETVGTAHSGNGWELLVVEKTIGANNATTLTAGFDVSSDTTAVIFWWNRAWLYYGDKERATERYAGAERYRVQHDGATHRVELPFTPKRGYQLRLVGRDTLTALGDTASSQPTATMELDEQSAQVLYSEAARILFGREGINAADFEDVANRMAYADQLRAELQDKWKYHLPEARAVRGPWAL